MPIVDALLFTLATWRIASIVTNESSPFDLLLKWRILLNNRLPQGHWLQTLFTCLYCFSVYVAFVLSWLYGLRDATLLISTFAFSGASILIEKVSLLLHSTKT